jgi:hypothetical protein
VVPAERLDQAIDASASVAAAPGATSATVRIGNCQRGRHVALAIDLIASGTIGLQTTLSTSSPSRM